MSLPTIKIVDAQHNNEEVHLEDLTRTDLGSLIHEGTRLVEKIRDVEAVEED